MQTVTASICPFCEPKRDRIFSENGLAFALWDGYAVSPGHALVIPKRHFANWFDTTDAERTALLALVDISKALIDQRHRPDGYNLGINVGAAAGQTVFHLHIHLIPRFTGDVADPRGGVRHVIPDKAKYVSS